MFHRPTSSNDQPAPSQGESKTMTQNPESNDAQADRSVDIPASPFQRPGQPPVAAAPAAPAPQAQKTEPAPAAATTAAGDGGS